MSILEDAHDSWVILTVEVSDAIIHFLLVGFSAVVLLISLSAYFKRREARYFFLSLAFTFLAISEVESLIETIFLSNELIVVPLTGIHLAHFMQFLMLSSFVLSLSVRPKEDFANATRR